MQTSTTTVKPESVAVLPTQVVSPPVLPSYVIASVEPTALKSVVEQLGREQGVRFVAPTTGRNNLILQFNSNETAKVYSFVSKIRSIKGLRRTRTLIPFEGYLTERKPTAGEALALALLNVQEQPGKVLESLKGMEIHSAYVVPGEFDIIATVTGRDQREVLERVARISELAGVDGSEVAFAYGAVWA